MDDAREYTQNALNEGCEIGLFNGECKVRVIGVDCEASSRVQRQAEPKLAKQQVSSVIPTGPQLETQQATVESDASRQVSHSKCQVVQASEHWFRTLSNVLR